MVIIYSSCTTLYIKIVDIVDKLNANPVMYLFFYYIFCVGERIFLESIFGFCYCAIHPRMSGKYLIPVCLSWIWDGDLFCNG